MSVEQGIDVPLCGLLDRSVVLDLDDVGRALDIGRAARLATEAQHQRATCATRLPGRAAALPPRRVLPCTLPQARYAMRGG